MVPYIIVFSITSFFTYLASRSLKENKKNKGIIYIILSILVLSVFVALRNDDIGKDIPVYVLPQYNWAKALDFLQYMNVGTMEYGYKVFVYIITLIFNDYHWILFFLEAIVCTNIYFFAYKQRNSLSIMVIIYLYLCLCYNDTFTMMRQYVAISFILLSIMYLLERKYINTFILFLLAISFHTTAIISVIIYIVILINNSRKLLGNSKKFLSIVTLMIFSICIVFYQEIIYFFTYTVQLFPSRIYSYFTSSYYTEEINISTFGLIFKLLCIFITMIYIKYNNKNTNKMIFFVLLLMDFEIYLISARLNPLLRLGYYFYYPSIFYILADIHTIIKKDKYNISAINLLLFVSLTFYWFYTFVLYGSGGNTVPYESTIINNLL